VSREHSTSKTCLESKQLSRHRKKEIKLREFDLPEGDNAIANMGATLRTWRAFEASL
jgi:hypothetical protein